VRSGSSTRASVATAPPLDAAKRGSLALRLVSAVLLAPPVLGAVWVGAPYFPILVTLAAGLMGWEWSRLSLGPRIGAAGAVLIATAVAAVGLAGAEAWRWALIVLAVGAIVVGALALPRARISAPWAALGLVWIALASIAAIWVRADAHAGRANLLWLFALVWSTDSAAYFVGKGVGGPRLAPRFSPGKTWSGALGGLLAAGLVGVATERLVGLPLISMVFWTSLGLSAVAQAGDLLESAAKRHFGAKDSSGLIPGHGGFLDRLDAMLAVLLLVGLWSALTGAAPLKWP
jgi:phosphatidate cytidylyltransferase